MDDILIKPIENGFIIIYEGKQYVSGKAKKSLMNLIGNILKDAYAVTEIKPTPPLPPPLPEKFTAKKITK